MTDVKLQTIEDCGRCHFSIEETAMIAELTLKYLREQMNDPNSAAYKHYHKGRLQTVFEVRKSIIDMAKKGRRLRRLIDFIRLLFKIWIVRILLTEDVNCTNINDR